MLSANLRTFGEIDSGIMSKKKALSTGDKTVLALSARGDCYNPDCRSPLVTQRDGRPIVQFEIAHIRDELPPTKQDAEIGWRYWPQEDLSQVQRNHFSNLILLCKPCHALIDKIDPLKFSSELLHEWKVKNEDFRGQSLAEALGVVEQSKLNELVVEALTVLGAFSGENGRKQGTTIRVDSILAEIIRYRKIIDELLIADNWVAKDREGLTTSLSAMAHNVTFEIVADTTLPSYVRQAAIDARKMAAKGRHPSSVNSWASYLQRDLKWEANRLRQCLADDSDPFAEEEPTFEDRNSIYDAALKKLEE